MFQTIGTKSFFCTDKVSAYRTVIQERSRKLVHEALGDGIEISETSTPVCAWLYYYLRKGERDNKKIRRVLELDQSRRAFIVGNDVTEYEEVVAYPIQEERFRNALKLIGSYATEMSALLEALSVRISVMPHFLKFESCSDPKLFGQIYYNFKREGILDWAEILVHEAAHHYAFVITSEAAARRYPWQTSVFSSIKNKQRPLIGLFHAAYAQAAMLELAFEIICAGTNAEPAAVVAGSTGILSKYGVGFLTDLMTLKPFGLLDYNEEVSTQFAIVRQKVEEWCRNNKPLSYAG